MPAKPKAPLKSREERDQEAAEFITRLPQFQGFLRHMEANCPYDDKIEGEPSAQTANDGRLIGYHRFIKDSKALARDREFEENLKADDESFGSFTGD